MGIFTEMCICQNQPIVSANQNLIQNKDEENNIVLNQDNKENLEEKKDNKKINNNNNEVSNDAETFNVSSKGAMGMMAPKRKKKAKDKISNKGLDKEKKRKKTREKKIPKNNKI